MMLRVSVVALLLMAAGCDRVKTIPVDFYPAAVAFKGEEHVAVVAGHRTVRDGTKTRHEIRIETVDADAGKRLGGRDLGAQAPGTFKFALSGDGSLLAAEQSDRSIGVWNVASGKRIARLPGFAEKSTPFAISRNEDEVIAGAMRWRIQGAKLLGMANETVATRLIGYGAKRALSKDDRLVAIALENQIRPGSSRPRLELHREPGGDLVHAFDTDEPSASSMLTRISPDGRFVLLQNTYGVGKQGGGTTSLTVWKTRDGAKAYRVEKPAACGFAAWSADGAIVLLRCVESSEKMYLESHRIE